MSAQQSESKPRFFRRVLMALAALAALLVCIGFVWFIWRDRSQAGMQTIVVDGAAPANDRRGPERRGDRLVVRKGLIEGFAGPIQLHVELDKQPVLPHLHHDEAGRWTNREQEELLEAGSRIVRGEGRLATLAISPEQKAQIAALNLYRRMVLPDGDQQKLNALCTAWNSALAGPPKAAAEQQLLAGVKEIGTRAADASRSAVTASADRIKQILTPEQLEKYRQITRAPRGPQPPAARPTTRP